MFGVDKEYGFSDQLVLRIAEAIGDGLVYFEDVAVHVQDEEEVLDGVEEVQKIAGWGFVMALCLVVGGHAMDPLSFVVAFLGVSSFGGCVVLVIFS